MEETPHVPQSLKSGADAGALASATGWVEPHEPQVLSPTAVEDALTAGAPSGSNPEAEAPHAPQPLKPEGGAGAAVCGAAPVDSPRMGIGEPAGAYEPQPAT